MHPGLFVSTAALAGAFLFFCIGGWWVHRRGVPPRPFAERAVTALIFALVGWQAVTWLRADHADATQTRVIAVWIQMISAFGIAGVLLAYGWLVGAGPSRGALSD